ncbi:MAG: NADH-quinone oxidoreductase subunit A [Coriobacteriales bacterium]|nr:NADH-quinone oxidoreductase subunit A [Coriobacteriales bacterium]
MQQTGALAVLFVAGLGAAAGAFILVVFLANAALSPRNPGAGKDAPYECGMEQIGQPWAPWRLKFGTIAMLFVLFDAEAVLLFSVVSKLKGSPAAFIEVFVFVTFLGLGLAYAWKKGALEWRL